MKVVTVTLNPSIDVTLWLDSLDPDDVNRVKAQRELSAGKGINVSKALHAMNVPTHALGFAGEENALSYERPLKAEGIPITLVRTKGAVRRNITLCLADGTAYKINTAGSPVDDSAIFDLRALLSRTLARDDLCVLSGSLPPGFETSDFLSFLDYFSALGTRLVLDVDFLSLADMKRIRPWLIKPNVHELRRVTGMGPEDGNLYHAARAVQSGGVGIVLLTMGRDGLIAVTGETTFSAVVPEVPVHTTVAAGDTTLAGFLTAEIFGFSPAETVRFAAACGVARVAKESDKPVTVQDAQVYMDQIVVTERDNTVL